MSSASVQVDVEVIAELRRRTSAGSINGCLRELFGMPPPRKRGWPTGLKRQGKRGKKAVKQK